MEKLELHYEITEEDVRGRPCLVPDFLITKLNKIARAADGSVRKPHAKSVSE